MDEVSVFCRPQANLTYLSNTQSAIAIAYLTLAYLLTNIRAMEHQQITIGAVVLTQCDDKQSITIHHAKHHELRVTIGAKRLEAWATKILREHIFAKPGRADVGSGAAR
jgi:hypothetical protein